MTQEEIKEFLNNMTPGYTKRVNNLKIKDKILCPIINEYIENEDCFDVHMALEGAPERTALEKIIKIENYKNICKNCKHHKNE